MKSLLNILMMFQVFEPQVHMSPSSLTGDQEEKSVLRWERDEMSHLIEMLHFTVGVKLWGVGIRNKAIRVNYVRLIIDADNDQEMENIFKC